MPGCLGPQRLAQRLAHIGLLQRTRFGFGMQAPLQGGSPPEQGGAVPPPSLANMAELQARLAQADCCVRQERLVGFVVELARRQ